MTITAKIIADSCSTSGKRITTFELEYPRFIHAELMTHRVFSRNAASSRAIPVSRSIELIKEDTAMPIHWGKNQPGMSAKEECDAHYKSTLSEKILDWLRTRTWNTADWCRTTIWNKARDAAIYFANIFTSLGYHKQIVNRLLEPFSHIKVVVTSTEFDNWFWLRNHPDAQPEIHRLAQVMWEEYEASAPIMIRPLDWHVPYYKDGVWIHTGRMRYSDFVDVYGVTLQDALAVSSSCCAQVSYRKLDDSIEKAKNIFDRLLHSLPPHFSPFEHQATPMPDISDFTVNGVTHISKDGGVWSGNFKGWIQHRQLIMEQLNIEPMSSSPHNMKKEQE